MLALVLIIIIVRSRMKMVQYARVDRMYPQHGYKLPSFEEQILEDFRQATGLNAHRRL